MIIYDAAFSRETVENIRYAYSNGYSVNARALNRLFN